MFRLFGYMIFSPKEEVVITPQRDFPQIEAAHKLAMKLSPIDIQEILDGKKHFQKFPNRKRPGEKANVEESCK